MAGIAGIAGAVASEEQVGAMVESIRHRGPDYVQVEKNASAVLGSCSAELGPTKTPALATDGSAVLLFDGEVYQPDANGRPDAEVALSLYREHGRLFPAHLCGVFACAVWDDGELVLARDACGVRPLYVGTTHEGGIAFASEVKALVGRVATAEEIQPQTVWSSRTGVQTYVPAGPGVEVPDDVVEARLTLRELLLKATARRLEDGAVGGLLLSGGLDSSVIACIAASLKPGLKAFTVGVPGAPDLDNAKLVAEHLGLEHHVRLFEPEDAAAAVPKAVFALESFDEDCVSGTIANLFASELARTHTPCILSGEGGDELNGGYLLLKDLPDDEARRKMMERLIEVAYNTALQRLDRAMMANGLTYRTPFLDAEVMAFCAQMPVSWKVHQSGDRLVEKWLLREAFKDMLPEPIYMREKLRFSGGTGTDGILDEALGVADAEPPSGPTPGGYQLSSPREGLYYRLFKERFPALCFENLVGRWDPHKPS